jgi:hypothetical protein
MSNEPRSGDPVLDELDDVRRRIFEECGNDPQRYIAFYREYQKQFADRLVSYEPEPREHPRRRLKDAWERPRIDN